MADRVREFEKLTSQLERMKVPTRAVGKVDICAIWKAARPAVLLVTKILRLLPFAWAKKAADILQILADALDKFCP